MSDNEVLFEDPMSPDISIRKCKYGLVQNAQPSGLNGQSKRTLRQALCNSDTESETNDQEEWLRKAVL